MMKSSTKLEALDLVVQPHSQSLHQMVHVTHTRVGRSLPYFFCPNFNLNTTLLLLGQENHIHELMATLFKPLILVDVFSLDLKLDESRNSPRSGWRAVGGRSGKLPSRIGTKRYLQ